jgi:phenylpyruvate tautomerase PptA (4-oxalocrotonate tautomerase family)
MSWLVDVSAEGGGIVVTSPVPEWLQIAAAAGTTFGVFFTALGVLIALYVAVWREPRKARAERAARDTQSAEERKRHDAQIAALLSAENDRLAAQARKVVPAVKRAEAIYGPNVWIVTVENKSTDIVADLTVRVTAQDAEGKPIANGCKSAGKVEISPLTDQILSEAIHRAIDIDSGGSLAMGMGKLRGVRPELFDPAGSQRRKEAEDRIKRKLDPNIAEKLQEAVDLGLTTEWPRRLIPEQTERIAYIAGDPKYELRVAIQYEDSAGYIWQRTDVSKPKRVTEAKSTN